jgi:pyruvate dehydrogenase E2 component (dihydrolipoamide acetyltransferase)
MKEFKLPDLGEGLREAEIVAWHVSEGDRVVTDQPLVSVETDKSVVEVPSPRSGVISALGAREGNVLQVGSMLVEFADGDSRESNTVVGSMDSAQSPASSVSANIPDETDSEVLPKAIPAVGKKVSATPSVRALARRLGVDIQSVTPTGRLGNITESDVEQAATQTSSETPQEPLRGMRAAMARRMTDAHARVVAAMAADEADVGSWSAKTDVTVRVIRAIVAGCHAEPRLNAWFDDEAMMISRRDRIDLGVAVDSEGGLFVPVIADIGEKDSNALRIELDELKKKVESRNLDSQSIRGATLTYSNYGALSVRFAQMVVVPPQVAILGSGQVHDAAVVVDGEVRSTRLLPISITFDHRVVTGGEAARFLRAVIGDLERPD